MAFSPDVTELLGTIIHDVAYSYFVAGDETTSRFNTTSSTSTYWNCVAYISRAVAYFVGRRCVGCTRDTHGWKEGGGGRIGARQGSCSHKKIEKKRKNDDFGREIPIIADRSPILVGPWFPRAIPVPETKRSKMTLKMSMAKCVSTR